MVGRINLRPDEGPVGCEAKEQGFHQTMMLTRATTGKDLRCGQRRYEFTCELYLKPHNHVGECLNPHGGTFAWATASSRGGVGGRSWLRAVQEK
jgi:hypothetical protein